MAQELNLDPKEVSKVWTAYWKFIKNHISSLPLKGEITEEEFSKLNPNINISSLGHLTCSYDRILKLKRKRSNENVEHQENETNVH